MKSVAVGLAGGLLLSLACARAANADALLSGGLFSGLTVASDYRYQGASESSGHPVVQGYVHWYRPDGFYTGVFVTQVDFGYDGAPTFEVDAYAGRNFEFDAGRTELKLEVMHTAYPDNRTPGPSFDFTQGKLQLKHSQGRWTTIALVSYVPQGSYGSGPLLRVEGETDFAVSKALTLKAVVGHQGEGIGHERTYWSLGAATTWKTVTFELRYVGTDRTRQDCGFQPTACDPALVGAITITLPPLVLGRM